MPKITGEEVFEIFKDLIIEEGDDTAKEVKYADGDEKDKIFAEKAAKKINDFFQYGILPNRTP